MTSVRSRAIEVLRRRRDAIPQIGPDDHSREGRGRTALVTGASSGIGWCFAELLAAKGYDVVAVARREERLKELKAVVEPRWNVAVHHLPCDLAAVDAAGYVAGELHRQDLAVDFLVNNAGVDLLGTYLEHSWAEHADFLRLMGWNVAELIHRLLPHMVEQRWGRIVNVTSVASLFPGAPSMVDYVAVKSFVHKISEGIAGEYEPHGVHSTVISPGAVQTEMLTVVGVDDYWNNNLLPQVSMLRPETVARLAYRACMDRRRVVVPGLPNKIWAATMRYAPTPVGNRLVEFAARMQNDAPPRTEKP
jgi:short-subunit dehydrogenase